MSVITNMVICCSIMEEDVSGEEDPAALVAINKWCKEHADGQRFKIIDMSKAGGQKTYCECVYACCGNYFPWEDFFQVFASFPWVSPEEAVLIIHDEHNEHAVVVRACGGLTQTGKLRP